MTFPYESNEEKDENEQKLNEIEEKVNKTGGNLKEAFLSKKNLLMVSFCFCGFCKFIKY
jgi:hypothetical protein